MPFLSLQDLRGDIVGSSANRLPSLVVVCEFGCQTEVSNCMCVCVGGLGGGGVNIVCVACAHLCVYVRASMYVYVCVYVHECFVYVCVRGGCVNIV